MDDDLYWPGREEPDGCPQADYATCVTCPHHGRCADDVTED